MNKFVEQFYIRVNRVRAIYTACDFPIRISATRGRDPLELVQPRPLFCSTHPVLRSLYILRLRSVHISLSLIRDIYARLNEHLL